MRARSLLVFSLVWGCGDGGPSSSPADVVAGPDAIEDAAEATPSIPDSAAVPDAIEDAVEVTPSTPDSAAAPDATADATEDATEVAPSAPLPVAFFYQDVAPTGNRVRVGATRDGIEIDSRDRDAATWTVFGQSQVFGDPVLSRLANGRWALTATASPEDPRGPFALLYYEADCPLGVPSPGSPAIRAIVAGEAEGCRRARETVMAKTSQIFAAYGSAWMFVSNMGSVQLLRVSDDEGGAGALGAICFVSSPAATREALAVGDATVVLASGVEGPIGDGTTSGPLLFSDAAIARRADGTWVLFVKGVSRALGCSGGGLCELCNRGVYRATSDDLLRWSALERVAFRASVPDAVTTPGGTVWLYWQDFGPACDTQDLQSAARAPIRAAFEQPDGALSTPIAVRFPEEPFETDPSLHYPTNANPVALPDAAAAAAFEACTTR